jgi:hypothetical protein
MGERGRSSVGVARAQSAKETMFRVVGIVGWRRVRNRVFLATSVWLKKEKCSAAGRKSEKRWYMTTLRLCWTTQGLRDGWGTGLCSASIHFPQSFYGLNVL